MQSKYKQTVLTGLLCNPLVSPAIKERILRIADDSWDWLLALVKSPLAKQCIPFVAELLDEQLAKAINKKIAKKDSNESELQDDDFFGTDNLIEAIKWFIRQPDVTVDAARPILEKFEQNDFWGDDYEYIVDAAIKNNDSRDGFLRFFISSRMHCFIYEAASNPSTPSKFLELIAKSSIPDALVSLAGNPSASKALLRILAKDNLELVMSPMSGNPNLPEEYIEKIARSDDRSAKISLFDRNDLNYDVIRILSADEDDYIRRLACRSPELPADVSKRLARDPEESVCAEIAKRIDLSFELIQDLYQRRSMEIDRALAANAAITDVMRDAFVKTNDKELLGAAFSNPKLTQTQLAKLTKEKNKSWITTWLFNRKGLCAQAIEILATSKHAETRERVAYMDNLPDSVLIKLAVDEDAEVRTAVAVHPRCTDVLLREIIALHNDDGDFHLPLRIAESKKSVAILELMLDKLLQTHQESIVEYKKFKAEGVTTFIVPRDFRSLKRFYENPLATERIKTKIAAAGFEEYLAENYEGITLADRLAEGVVTAKAVQKTLTEKFSTKGNERFLEGFASSKRLGEDMVDFLLKKVA
jgi:plasmid stabilization system protein ParE